MNKNKYSKHYSNDKGQVFEFLKETKMFLRIGIDLVEVDGVTLRRVDSLKEAIIDVNHSDLDLFFKPYFKAKPLITKEMSLGETLDKMGVLLCEESMDSLSKEYESITNYSVKLADNFITMNSNQLEVKYHDDVRDVLCGFASHMVLSFWISLENNKKKNSDKKQKKEDK